MEKMEIIHMSFAKIYKYKSLVIDWNEYLGPIFLRHKDHRAKDMSRIGRRQWGEFVQWWRMSDDEREAFRIY